MLSANDAIHSHCTTEAAAVGRHQKRGGAAFIRATSFVVSFVVVMNRVDVVAALKFVSCG